MVITTGMRGVNDPKAWGRTGGSGRYRAGMVKGQTRPLVYRRAARVTPGNLALRSFDSLPGSNGRFILLPVV